MKRPDMRRAIWLLPLVSLALISCASGPKIRSQSDPAAALLLGDRISASLVKVKQAFGMGEQTQT